MALVSGSIRFMRIFTGFLWTAGVKRQRGNRKCRLLVHAFRRYISRSLGSKANAIIVLFVAFTLTQKCGTLNDFKWPFYAKFCFRGNTSRIFCVDFENNWVKTDKNKRIQSASEMYARDSSCWQYTVYLPSICFSFPYGHVSFQWPVKFKFNLFTEKVQLKVHTVIYVVQRPYFRLLMGAIFGPVIELM